MGVGVCLTVKIVAMAKAPAARGIQGRTAGGEDPRDDQHDDIRRQRGEQVRRREEHGGADQQPLRRHIVEQPDQRGRIRRRLDRTLVTVRPVAGTGEHGGGPHRPGPRKYYAMGIKQLRAQGREVPDELLSFIAPGHRENINFFGFIEVDIEGETAKLDDGGHSAPPWSTRPAPPSSSTPELVPL